LIKGLQENTPPSPDITSRFLPAIIQAMHINVNGRKRNDPCPCGSGKKFKKCCIDKNKPEDKVNKDGIRDLKVVGLLKPLKG